MIKPTIGRVVWYYEDSTLQDQPMPGIVCYVYSDTRVNLAVFTPNGVNESRSSVYLWQGEGDRPIVNFAEWMPYQKGQAARTEELETKLKS